MGRGGWLGVATVGAVGAAGLGVWTWFLAGRSLDVMDQWSSVVSSFGTLASLVVAVIALVVAVRSPGSAGAGSRQVHVGGSVTNSQMSLGDNSPVNGKDR